MKNFEIVKKLEEMEKTIAYLKKQLKSNDDAQLSPLQAAVRVITTAKSTNDEIKTALNTLVQTAQQLSFKQCAFCLFFALMNHNQLGEDVDYWFGLELGKHNYKERTKFIQLIQETINNNYKANPQFKQKINSYLDSKKK